MVMSEVSNRFRNIEGEDTAGIEPADNGTRSLAHDGPTSPDAEHDAQRDPNGGG